VKTRPESDPGRPSVVVMRSTLKTSAVTPTWAGYAAALFGLEYTVAKAVMAVRGELGLPGHPAPPEAYEGVSDVAAAQFGSAALGLVPVAVALALVQRWGRRIPAAVLAAGAVVALVGVTAGAVVVTTSLVGLREDHGQWGLDSLLLAAAPVLPWLLLTAAALRAARAEGLPPWARELPGRTLRALRAGTRPGRRAALAAAAASAAYGALKLEWALGGELLLRQTPLTDDALRDMLEREPGAVASHWGAVALAATGVALAVATVGGRRLPRLITIGLPALLGVLMLLRAGWGAASDIAVLTGVADGSDYPAGWDLGLWSPFFGAWGAAWCLAALAAWRRAVGPQRRFTPPEPAAPECTRARRSPSAPGADSGDGPFAPRRRRHRTPPRRYVPTRPRKPRGGAFAWSPSPVASSSPDRPRRGSLPPS
jgi:Protein of unknown function (DUF3995)